MNFNPKHLDRSIIAIPLLEQMKPELDLIDAFNRDHPEIVKDFNTAIQLNPDYPGGLQNAFQTAESLLTNAALLARKTFDARLKGAGPKWKAIEQLRRDALEEAIGKQTIKPPEEGRQFSVANLHATVARRLWSLNSDLEKKGIAPILRILPQRFEIIIDLNLEFPGGRDLAREWVRLNLPIAKQQAGVNDVGQEIHEEKSDLTNQYLFANLEARAICRLVAMDLAQAKEKAQSSGTGTAKGSISAHRVRAIYHIWPDFEVSTCITRSIATVKANAAQNSFSARGKDITWAVMDSGIDSDHIHFAANKNVDKNSAWHKDFTTDGGGPLMDENGHGSHVAGIIAGECVPAPGEKAPLAISRSLKTDTEDVEYHETQLEAVRGMAPECKLVSLKVLDQDGKGSVSNLIAAIAHVQEINGYGRRLLIQGVNMSLGYSFDPEWFACGQSPLCVEIDRLVRSGVVVVVAAGNTGYGTLKSTAGATAAGLALTINDPGNADLAITVGSTHRDMPHIYGVSYFSSKGPTGDGRLKPDLLAPGEKIISCAIGNLKAAGAAGHPCDYVETSGTSMAAPHVSGVIAAFLSVRSEFIGQSERVKEIFMSTATDLRRDRYFQGAGLIDLMRAIQSI